MGFSLAGLVVSLVILAPTFLLVVAPPRGVPAAGQAVPLVLTVLERAGQVGCLVLPAITGREGGAPAWLVVVIVLVAGYYALWARYLLGGRRFAHLYASLGPLPVPMAVLPVLAFLATGAWLSSWPQCAAAVVLALGHVPGSWLVARGLEQTVSSG